MEEIHPYESLAAPVRGQVVITAIKAMQPRQGATMVKIEYTVTGWRGEVQQITSYESDQPWGWYLRG